MPRILIWLAILLFPVAGVSLARGVEFKIQLKADGALIPEIVLRIEGDMATVTAAGTSEKFNVKEQSWLDSSTGKWTTLSECEQWMDLRKAALLRSVETAPANVQPFLRWSVEPTFKVEKTNDALRLISGQVDYLIEGRASDANVESYYRYAILNSYKKAMTERKVPPFSELKAIAEMQKLGYIPRKMTVTMPGLPGAPSFEVEITEFKSSGG